MRWKLNLLSTLQLLGSSSEASWTSLYLSRPSLSIWPFTLNSLLNLGLRMVTASKGPTSLSPIHFDLNLERNEALSHITTPSDLAWTLSSKSFYYCRTWSYPSLSSGIHSILPLNFQLIQVIFSHYPNHKFTFLIAYYAWCSNSMGRWHAFP